jgi:hypothetical protein
MSTVNPRSDRTVTPRTDRETASTGLSVLNAIAAIWVILSPFFLSFTTPAMVWNNVIVGIIILILAGIRASNPLRNVEASWVNALLGIWLIISPFVLMTLPRNPLPVWNNVILGIIVLALSIGSAFSTKNTNVPMASR